MRVLTLSSLAALGVCASSVAHAETFDVQPVVICPTADAYCGYPSLIALRDAFRSTLVEVNLEFRPTHISFRPLDPIVIPDNDLASITDAKGMSANGGSNADLIDKVLDGVVAKDPSKIYMLLKSGLNKCWNGLPCPVSDPSGVSQDDMVFCSLPGPGKGRTYAHELGHYWCLAHTHTFEDAPENSPVDRDGDDERCWVSLPKVTDTPADPGNFEAFALDSNGNPKPGLDETKSKKLIEKHEFCTPTKETSVDASSPHGSFCEIACSQVSDGQAEPTAFAPLTENAMSYYGKSGCRGPYVIGGERFEAFTDDQVAVTEACRAKDDMRKKLVDVCKEKGGDHDHDGWCDNEDLCPGVADTVQVDTDGDGVPNACDKCPDNPDPSNVDTDLDGLGDACDADIDNDGCGNDVDQHPDQSHVGVGTAIYPNCVPSRGTFEVDESTDTDHDGIANCADDDDDDDGIPDEEDDCAISANPLGCISFGASCPVTTIWAQLCGVMGCNLFTFLVESVNPDPTLIARFDAMEVVDNVIYLRPMAGFTLTESAAMLSGTASLSGAPNQGKQQLLMSHKESGRVFPLVTYDPELVRVGDLTQGRLLRLEVSPDGSAVSLRATWTVGDSPDAARIDGDRDGVPDFADNCRDAFNPSQRDADLDHFGDACDADLDQTFFVDKQDYAVIDACFGVDLTIGYGPGACEDEPGQKEDASAQWLQIACERFDLDADGVIGERDLTLVYRAIDTTPGPSGLTVLPKSR